MLSGFVFGARSFKPGPGRTAHRVGQRSSRSSSARWPGPRRSSSATTSTTRRGYRFVDCLDTGEGSCAAAGTADPTRNRFLFGRQDPKILSLTLRQTFVFAPRLTLQIYAQLFTAGSHYTDFAEASARAGERIDLDDLTTASRSRRGGQPRLPRGGAST